MKRTRVKICGFTRADEAVYAAQLGVDAIGLVFYPKSSRYVDIAQAANIVRVLPVFVSVVALFVDEQEDKIREIMNAVPVDCIQFHGDESAADCRKFGKRYMKAVRMHPEINIDAVVSEYEDASGLLLDAYDPGLKGGTGVSFDWDMVPKDSTIPIILAGGLDHTNVADAIKKIKPYAVDVSSGVEADKGRKDSAKMVAFINKVLETDRTL